MQLDILKTQPEQLNASSLCDGLTRRLLTVSPEARLKTATPHVQQTYTTVKNKTKQKKQERVTPSDKHLCFVALIKRKRTSITTLDVTNVSVEEEKQKRLPIIRGVKGSIGSVVTSGKFETGVSRLSQ